MLLRFLVFSIFILYVAQGICRRSCVTRLAARKYLLEMFCSLAIFPCAEESKTVNEIVAAVLGTTQMLDVQFIHHIHTILVVTGCEHFAGKCEFELRDQFRRWMGGNERLHTVFPSPCTRMNLAQHRISLCLDRPCAEDNVVEQGHSPLVHTVVKGFHSLGKIPFCPL